MAEDNKISPDFIGDDPKTMKEGTITPIPKKAKTPKCKACGSGSVYIRIKKRSVVCRRCGHIDPIEDKS